MGDLAMSHGTVPRSDHVARCPRPEVTSDGEKWQTRTAISDSNTGGASNLLHTNG